MRRNMRSFITDQRNEDGITWVHTPSLSILYSAAWRKSSQRCTELKSDNDWWYVPTRPSLLTVTVIWTDALMIASVTEPHSVDTISDKLVSSV
jgi:hypothetical protein